MPDYHWVLIARPLEVVRQQLLELDPPWLADTARTATTHSESGAATQVRVRLEKPSVAAGALVLPMEWEVTGSILPPILRGDLQGLRACPTETRLGIRMEPPYELLPSDEEERARIHGAVEGAAVCFLNRLFWTLEALSRDDRRGPERTNPTWRSTV